MLISAIPKIPFINKQSTIGFYVRQLGFRLLSDYGDYLIMKLDLAELQFFSFPDLQPEQSDFMVYIRIDKGIEELYKKLQDQRITIHPNGALTTKAWKQKEFSINDPNGTLVTFGEAGE